MRDIPIWIEGFPLLIFHKSTPDFRLCLLFFEDVLLAPQSESFFISRKDVSPKYLFRLIFLLAFEDSGLDPLWFQLTVPN